MLRTTTTSHTTTTTTYGFFSSVAYWLGQIPATTSEVTTLRRDINAMSNNMKLGHLVAGTLKGSTAEGVGYVATDPAQSHVLQPM